MTRIGLRHKQQHLSLDVHADAGAYRIDMDGHESRVEVRALDQTSMALVLDGSSYRVDIVRDGRDCLVAIAGEVYRFVPEPPTASNRHVDSLATPEITAPMPGKVMQILVKVGDHVDAGEGLLVLEAMKMESRLVSDAVGTVVEIRVADGEMVEGGQVLIVLEYPENTAPA